MRTFPLPCLVDTLRKSGTNPGAFYLVPENLDQLQRTSVRIYRVTSTSGEANGLIMAERAVFMCPGQAPDRLVHYRASHALHDKGFRE